MARMPIALSLALVSAVAVSLQAQQARPDLSGRWTLVESLSTPPGASAFGPTLVIAQAADSITLDQQISTIHFASGVSSSVTQIESGGSMRLTYVADGIDHDVPQLGSTTPPPPNARVIGTYGVGGDRSYRAVWSARQLVIMTHDSRTLLRPNNDPVPIRRMIRQALALAADGTLVADSLIVADPVPGSFFFNDTTAPEQTAPVPVRSIYRRAQ